MTIAVSVPIIAPAAPPTPSGPLIWDDFNRAQGAPINPASDGGTWTLDARKGHNAFDPDVALTIDNGRASLVYIDPNDGQGVFGQISRLIPGTLTSYEFSQDVYRGRAGGSDAAVVMYFSEAALRPSQTDPGYRFTFSQYPNGSHIVRLNTSATFSADDSVGVYGPWAQGVTRRLTVRREDAVLTMLVNGVVVFSWTDPAPNPHGRWCMIVNGDYYDRFDNFSAGAVGTTL